MNKTSPSPRLFNIANIMSASRIILVPLVLVLLALVKPEINDFSWRRIESPSAEGLNLVFCVLATISFTIACFTDFFDGYLARKYQLVTNLGKLLDPLADKILILGTLVMLVELNRIPSWMVVIILIRELSVTTLRSLAGSEGVVISASWLGKYKTVFQDFSVGFLVLYYPIGGANLHIVGMVLFILALILTIWSGIYYFVAHWPLISGKNK